MYMGTFAASGLFSSTKPFCFTVISDIVGPPQRLAYLDIGHVHVYERREVHRVARRRLGRLDVANKIRAKKRQRHVRVSGKSGYLLVFRLVPVHGRGNGVSRTNGALG